MREARGEGEGVDMLAGWHVYRSMVECQRSKMPGGQALNEGLDLASIVV